MRQFNEFAGAAGRGRALVALMLMAALSGCVTADSQTQSSANLAQANFVDQIREVDLSARYPQESNPVDKPALAGGPQAASYYGDRSSPIAEARASSEEARPSSDVEVNAESNPLITRAVYTPPGRGSGSKGYEINFENTPVSTVAKTVLGDILGVGYTIDPRVTGTVSLSSGRPVPKKDLLFVLESALKVSNVALVRDGGNYRLIPAAEAVGSGGGLDAGHGPDAGYGITVVPVQYVSAQTLTKLLDNFAAKPGMVRADPTRNLVVVQGSAEDRRAALDTMRGFDSDWMRGQSVGIYPVSNSAPEPIISELEKIVDSGEGGLSQNVVKLQSVGRQNAILVVTRKPELLKTVATWISRLDRSGSAGTGVKVYRMRYGDARQMAALLNEIFLSGPTSVADSPFNQLAPGGGAVASANEGRGLNGSQSASAPQGPGASLGTNPGGLKTPASFNARFADASGKSVPNADLANGRAGNGGNGSFNPSAALGGAPPLLPNVRIAADVAHNALLIYANQENYHIIEQTLRQLDRPRLQVAIDATIAEVSINDNLNYGVQFFLQSNNGKASVINSNVVNPLATAASAGISRVLPGFNFLAGTEVQPQVILDALHGVTDVRILSTPSLVVLDNQFATLQVGDQIPITTGSATVLNTNNTVVNTVDYRNTGVILRVAPQINANGSIVLDIEQEISRVANTATANTLTPTVSQRKVRSSIAVTSGQTVLLGGLRSEEQDFNRGGMPVLDQLPGLGALFSHTNTSGQRTELIIFIRPQIIRNGLDAHRVAQELREKVLTGRLRMPDAPSPDSLSPASERPEPVELPPPTPAPRVNAAKAPRHPDPVELPAAAAPAKDATPPRRPDPAPSPAPVTREREAKLPRQPDPGQAANSTTRAKDGNGSAEAAPRPPEASRSANACANYQSGSSSVFFASSVTCMPMKD
jgi:general secretion pathway protein D